MNFRFNNVLRISKPCNGTVIDRIGKRRVMGNLPACKYVWKFVFGIKGLVQCRC